MLSVLVGNILSTIALGALMKKPPTVQKFAKGDIINILDELNAMIKLEFIAVVEAPNTLRQIDVISDVNKIQREVVQNVTNGLSTKFFLMCNQAGLKKDYIYTYITRKTLYEIWGYMREHNFTPKKG
jgi:hypothetical protein